MIPTRRAVRLFLGTLFAAAFMAMPAVARSAGHVQGQIAFYGDILDIIDSHSPLLVRPSTLLLSEDGSVALDHLKWSGWGSNVARATGELSASSCVPSCADGKRTNSPVQLTLSDPGLVLGHRVYRCFRISPHHLQSGPIDHGCIHLEGKLHVYASGENLRNEDSAGHVQARRKHQAEVIALQEGNIPQVPIP